MLKGTRKIKGKIPYDLSFKPEDRRGEYVSLTSVGTSLSNGFFFHGQGRVHLFLAYEQQPDTVLLISYVQAAGAL